jgi:hypothetical protein
MILVIVSQDSYLCLEYEIHNKLGPKIKKKDEPRAPDDDQFLSRYECGHPYAIHETFAESKIKDPVETTDNPHNNESIFMSTDSRATQRRKGRKVRRARSAKWLNTEHEDPEIQAAIDKGLAVNILYDSNH